MKKLRTFIIIFIGIIISLNVVTYKLKPRYVHKPYANYLSQKLEKDYDSKVDKSLFIIFPLDYYFYRSNYKIDYNESVHFKSQKSGKIFNNQIRENDDIKLNLFKINYTSGFAKGKNVVYCSIYFNGNLYKDLKLYQESIAMLSEIEVNSYRDNLLSHLKVSIYDDHFSIILSSNDVSSLFGNHYFNGDVYFN